ncbi:MAG: TIGR01777 family oxidoreductase [Thermoplasmataceae archaeon]
MSQNKRLVIAGATGSIGRYLCQELGNSGYEITVLARDPTGARTAVPSAKKIVKFDYEGGDGWFRELDGSLGVINLSGAPIFKRWTKRYMNEIIDSRVKTTGAIVDAIRIAKDRPRFLVNASAAGYYGYDGGGVDTVTESSPAGNDFWGKFVSKWEGEAKKANDLGVRVSLIRTTVVLVKGEGALGLLVPLFRKGIGGYVKSATPWFPWIHMSDEVSLIKFAIENNQIYGAINASSPNIPTMQEFSATLGKVLNKRSSIRIPPSLLRLILGKGSSVISRGLKVYPKVALDNGFKFSFPNLEDALRNLLY